MGRARAGGIDFAGVKMEASLMGCGWGNTVLVERHGTICEGALCNWLSDFRSKPPMGDRLTRICLINAREEKRSVPQGLKPSLKTGPYRSAESAAPPKIGVFESTLSQIH
jgi:hypothetical protein